MPYFEDDDDPKKPRPVHARKKSQGWQEREELGPEGFKDDDDRGNDDHHRHVHVRC